MAEIIRLNLGIIGSCASYQPWMSVPALYHRKLHWMLRHKDNVHLHTYISPPSSEEPQDRFLALLKKKPIAVLLFNPSGVSSRAALVFMRRENGKQKYRIHPFLRKQPETGWIPFIYEDPDDFSREIGEKSSRLSDPHEEEMPRRKIFGLSLRDLNFLAGFLVGLDDWAIRNELAVLRRLKTACDEQNVPLVVLGPSPRFSFHAEKELWHRLNDALAQKLPATKKNTTKMDTP